MTFCFVIWIEFPVPILPKYDNAPLQLLLIRKSLPFPLPGDHVAINSYKNFLSYNERSLIPRRSATATRTQRTVASDLLIPEASVPASEVRVAQSELLSKALVERTSTDLG